MPVNILGLLFTVAIVFLAFKLFGNFIKALVVVFLIIFLVSLAKRMGIF